MFCMPSACDIFAQKILRRSKLMDSKLYTMTPALLEASCGPFEEPIDGFSTVKTGGFGGDFSACQMKFLDDRL